MVSQVSGNAFSGLTNVEHLILPSGIRRLQPDAFNGLDSVGLLKLSFMDLTSLQPHTFRGLGHVHVLAIQDSDLGDIRPDAFAGLAHVGSLNVLNNKIDAVHGLRVAAADRVRHVRFNGNHVLDSPRRGAFAVAATDGFAVVGNRFPCDCRLFRFLDGRPFGNGTTAAAFAGQNYCISPIELNGQPVSAVGRPFVDKCLQQTSSAARRPLAVTAVAGLLPLVLWRRTGGGGCV